ncbi:MAG TPA: hypothetical protein VGM88_30365 [Kofleriaceae bacterium]|jgi:hypothetical protein
MNDRAKIGIIIGTVAALTIGGGVWFFAIHNPAARRADAQAEIARWESRWADARKCLLGNAPRSTKTGEALAIRELEPDPWDRKGCVTFIGALNRGEAPSTGIAEVEEAWQQLDGAAQRVAAAFGQHVDPTATDKKDLLPEALDGLDAAHERLRVAAGLSATAPTTGPATPPLVVATIVPLRDGQSAVTWLEEGQYTPSAHGVALAGRSGSIQVQVALVAGKAPIVARGPENLLRGVPDATWGAQFDDSALLVGPVDPDGKLANPGSIKLDAAGAIAAAVGRGDQGLVIAGTMKELTIIHVAGTMLTQDAPVAIDRAAGGEDVDGRAFAMWSHGHDVFGRWLSSDPTALPRPAIALDPTLTIAVPCFTADAVWLQGGESTIEATTSGELHRVAAVSDPIAACNPSGILIPDSYKARMYTTCAPPKPCLATTLPASFERSSPVVYKGALAAVALHGTVAAVWREGVPLVYFSIPDHVTLATAREAHGGTRWNMPLSGMTDDKVIDVLVTQADGGYAILRLPLQ